MTNRISTPFALFGAASTVLFIAACTAATGAPDESSSASSADITITPAPTTVNVYDPCANQSPDYILYVPQSYAATGVPYPSKTGFYGYRPGCNMWIADIKLAGYSHTYFDPQTQQYIQTPLLYSSGAYDLPSSNGFGGTTPTNAEDCNRDVESGALYMQDYNQSQLTWLCSWTRQGVWSNGACGYKSVSAAGTCPNELDQPPMNSGWRTYRIAVSTQERTSYQETSFSLHEAPPR